MNQFCPPNNNDNLCLLFCLYPSSMCGVFRWVAGGTLLPVPSHPSAPDRPHPALALRGRHSGGGFRNYYRRRAGEPAGWAAGRLLRLAGADHMVSDRIKVTVSLNLGPFFIWSKNSTWQERIREIQYSCWLSRHGDCVVVENSDTRFSNFANRKTEKFTKLLFSVHKGPMVQCFKQKEEDNLVMRSL